MKKLLLITYLISQNIFAMSCPNNGNIINTGSTVEQIVQTCGQPASTRDSKIIKNVNETLTYYKNLLGYNVKVTLTFSHDKLANINIVDTRNTLRHSCQTTNQFGQTINSPCAPQEQNLSTSGVCGPLIQAGNSVHYVRSICGAPAEEKIGSTITTQIKELTYSGVGPNILVFENDELVDWK